MGLVSINIPATQSFNLAFLMSSFGVLILLPVQVALKWNGKNLKPFQIKTDFKVDRKLVRNKL